MKFYAYNENGYLIGQIDGAWDPRAKKYSPRRNCTAVVPPDLPDKKIAHWDGEKWNIVDDLEAIQREENLNYEKLRHRNADDVALYKIDINGKVVPKTEEELKFDVKLLKKGLVLEAANQYLQNNLLYILKITLGEDPKIKEFLAAINNIIENVDDQTEVDNVTWPEL